MKFLVGKRCRIMLHGHTQCEIGTIERVLGVELLIRIGKHTLVYANYYDVAIEF